MKKRHKKFSFSRKKYFAPKYSNKKIRTTHTKLFSKLLIIFALLILKFDDKLHEAFLNFFGSKRKIKVCMCAIAKKENLYIEYFIKHYKQLGYDHIYLYDNNEPNEERLEDIIKKYIDEGFVTLIDIRGQFQIKKDPQVLSYYDCYEKHNKEYDWLSFFDIDEYLMLKPKGIKIQKFLENERYRDCPNVKINWLMFSDNGQVKYEKKPLIKRFPKPAHDQSKATNIKSIMRGNISYHKLAKAYSPHYLYYGLKSCSSSGKVIEGTFWNDPPDYGYATLNHYVKSITEYVAKLKRGFFNKNLNLNKKKLRHVFDKFFSMNEKTEEKIKIFNDAFNTDFK